MRSPLLEISDFISHIGRQCAVVCYSRCQKYVPNEAEESIVMPDPDKPAPACPWPAASRSGLLFTGFSFDPALAGLRMVSLSNHGLRRNDIGVFEPYVV